MHTPFARNPLPAQRPADGVYDLTAAEMNSAEIAEWDRFHASLTDRQRALLMTDEPSYQDLHKRWLWLLRKRQSDHDRKALGFEPYTLEQAPPPSRPY